MKRLRILLLLLINVACNCFAQQPAAQKGRDDLKAADTLTCVKMKYLPKYGKREPGGKMGSIRFVNGKLLDIYSGQIVSFSPDSSLIIITDRRTPPRYAVSIYNAIGRGLNQFEMIPYTGGLIANDGRFVMIGPPGRRNFRAPKELTFYNADGTMECKIDERYGKRGKKAFFTNDGYFVLFTEDEERMTIDGRSGFIPKYQLVVFDGWLNKVVDTTFKGEEWPSLMSILSMEVDEINENIVFKYKYIMNYGRSGSETIYKTVTVDFYSNKAKST